MIEISKLLPMVVARLRSIIVTDAIGGSFENSKRDEEIEPLLIRKFNPPLNIKFRTDL